MTIRIHEADGTPYEHVVDLKEPFTKLDIQYNTKYKRLKRSKKQKEHVDVLNIDTADDADLDGILLHCLGDVLQSDQQMEEWKLEDWTKEEEEKMMNEAFEWIRVDTDFEWICLLYINQPDYMFASQLQQDRDVVAQYDAVRYFGSLKPSRLYSSILVKTLMDKRYYYGIRVEAAHQLAKCGIEDLNFIGKFHLVKAFQTMFCFENSTIPAANNFSDFPTYFIQKAIPMALSQIRDNFGKCPVEVCNFLLDLLRYNDNSSNPFSDSFYVCNLITAIVNALSNNNFEPSLEEGDFETDSFVSKAIDEIERCLRMDGWLPSVHNMITTTAIQQKERLWVRGYLPVKFDELIQYSKPGNYSEVRISAFQSLLNLGGVYNKAVVHYLFSTIVFDNFEFVKAGLVNALCNTLGRLALRGDYKPRLKVRNAGGNGQQQGAIGSFLVVEDSSVTKDVRHDLQARSTVKGALELLKRQMDRNAALKRELWSAINSRRISLYEKRRLLDISSAVFAKKDSYIVDLKTPKLMRLRAIRGQRFNIVIKRQFAFSNSNGAVANSGSGVDEVSRPLPKISFVAKKSTSPKKNGGHGAKLETASSIISKKQKSHKIKLTAGSTDSTGSTTGAAIAQPSIHKIKLSTNTTGATSGAGVTKKKKSGSSGSLPAAVKLNPDLLSASVTTDTSVTSFESSVPSSLNAGGFLNTNSTPSSGTVSNAISTDPSSSTDASQPALPKVKLKLRLN